MNSRCLLLFAVLLLHRETLAQDATTYSGITESAKDAELSFAVSGVLASFEFGEGEYVPQGEIICSLNHEAQKLEVARREVVLMNAKRDLSRTERLFSKTGSVSQEELDEKRATAKVAEVELGIAEEESRRRLLVAPFSGVIANTFGLEVGEGAELLRPVIRLVDTSRCYLVCNLPASAVEGVHVGSKATVKVQGVQKEATVDFLSPVLDPSSGLLKVKVVFDNSDAAVMPGAAGSLQFAD